MSTDLMTIPTGTSNSDDLSDQRIGNDVELRELVYQSLERDGLITRIKAQLRAAVFKTIEKAANSSSTTSHLPSNDGITGRICRALVLDWLEYSRLLYTEDVFKVETTGPNHPAPLTRTELLEQLHIKSNQNVSQPILHVLLDENTNRVKENNSIEFIFNRKKYFCFLSFSLLQRLIHFLIILKNQLILIFQLKKLMILILYVIIFVHFFHQHLIQLY